MSGHGRERGERGTRTQVEGKARRQAEANRFSVRGKRSALGEVVRSDLDGHSVAGDDPDEILAHLARNVGQDAMAIFQLDHELGVGKRLHDSSFRSDRFFFGHTDLL